MYDFIKSLICCSIYFLLNQKYCFVIYFLVGIRMSFNSSGISLRVILCRILKANSSTYYKHFSSEPNPRIRENQYIASPILHIYADYTKRLCAYNITYILPHDYDINISIENVSRLLKTLYLPRISTHRTAFHGAPPDNTSYTNHLKQGSRQKPHLLFYLTNPFSY